jgi:hypothetical protein
LKPKGGFNEAMIEGSADNAAIRNAKADLFHKFRRREGVCMQEKEDIPSGFTGTGIHQARTRAAFGMNDGCPLPSHIRGSVGAASFGNKDFGNRGALSQIGQGLSDARLFVSCRNNDAYLQ